MTIDYAKIRDFYERQKDAARRRAPEYYGTVETSEEIIRFKKDVEERHLSSVFTPRPLSTVLDLGAGSGRWSFFFAPRAARVTAVDFSPRLLGIAREEAERRGLRNIRFVESSLTDFRAPERFDVVVISNALAYVNDEDLPRVRQVVMDHLAPGGTLIVKEPVSTGGRITLDDRKGINEESGDLAYSCVFRPAREYRELFPGLRLRYAAPTCAHLVPFFMKSTNDAASAVRSRRSLRLPLRAGLAAMARLDPQLRGLERAMRASPRAARLLAREPVVQELLLFENEAAPDPAGVSIVVIGYNEEENVEPFVASLRGVAETLAVPYEIILVDDGSTDGTGRVMQALARGHGHVVHVAHERNRGMGAALVTGFSAATMEHVTWYPSDGQVPAETLPALLAAAKEADFVVTRYERRTDGAGRLLMSHSLSLLIALVLGIDAFSGGTYLFRRRIWERLSSSVDTMLLGVALRARYKRMGGRFARVRIPCRERMAGRSKVANTRTIARTFVSLLKIRLGA